MRPTTVSASGCGLLTTGQPAARALPASSQRSAAASVVTVQADENVSTVLEAYLQLENAGLIEVRPKSGHFVRRRSPLTAEPSAPKKSAS